MKRTHLWTQRGKERVEQIEKVDDFMCKINSQWEAAVLHREPSPALCDGPQGWGGVGGGEGGTRREGYA